MLLFAANKSGCGYEYLCPDFGSRPAVSRHLRVLEDAGLVEAHGEGTRNIYSIRMQGFASVREFVEIAFARAGLDWRPYVIVDERFYRPAEAVLLKADNAKARRVLGWQPETSFAELVNMMVDADLELLGSSQEHRPHTRIGMLPREAQIGSPEVE